MNRPHDDIRRLEQWLDESERNVRALVADVDEALGTWRPDARSWSVAECLDHLATGNRIYLDAMAGPAARALRSGRTRRRPATPGLVGGWFVRALEPPVPSSRRMRAPARIRPRKGPSMHDALEQFIASHARVRDFLRTYADIDLAGVTFPNPFIPGVRFSLATGLHVLAAHTRRHLWQAWNVRRSAERRGPV
jgi:hypothetical protein